MSIKKSFLFTHTIWLHKSLCLTAALIVFGLTGCASTGGGAMTQVWQQVKTPFKGSMFAKTDDLKNPTKTHLSYAKYKEETGELDEAQKSYEEVLKTSPKSIDAIVGLALIDQLAGRNFQAQKGYQKALQLNPNNPQALDAMGQFYASKGRWDNAVDLLTQAMLAGPNEPLYKFHLAVAKTKQGDVQGAIPLFTKTVGEAEGHFNIGRILLSDGKIAGAGQQFNLAYTKKPSLVEAKQLLQELKDQYPNEIQLAGATRSNARYEQERNQRAIQPHRQFAGYQQESQFSAPVITPGRRNTSVQPVDYSNDQFSGHQAGHSTFPASFEQANEGMVTPSDFQRRNTPESFNTGRTSHDGLTPSQREQLQNQFRSQR